MSNTMTTLQDLFLHELADLYSAEKQILEALPAMIKVTSNPQLKKGFEMHLKETEEQKKRIEELCEKEGLELENTTCKGMKGVIEEGKEIMKMDAEPEVLDAGLIIAAQRVEHYEIAGYGSAIAHAKQLGMNDAAKILVKTLDEEKATDEKLTKIAETKVNKKAEN